MCIRDSRVRGPILYGWRSQCEKDHENGRGWFGGSCDGAVPGRLRRGYRFRFVHSRVEHQFLSLIHICARGLRSVMEDLLTDLMFEVPSDHTIEKVVVTRDCVLKIAKPEIVKNPDKKPNRLKTPVKRTPRRKVTA